MLLLPYDGSDDAKASIDQSAALMSGSPATVLTVWEPLAEALARSGSIGFGGVAMFGAYPDIPAADEATANAALACATEGADRARAAGLSAEPMCVTRTGSIAQTIIGVAERVEADVIAMGTRGRGGMESFLLGSVSHAVVQHADRAVLIVPSTTLATRRRSGLDRDASAV